jgi:GNAT superfamily N-acetyltransferase
VAALPAAVQVNMQVVHYGPEYESRHRVFAKQFWTKRKRTEADYLYWKYRGGHRAELPSFLLIEEDERVIGQLGLIPCSIEIEGEVISAQWACDLMVDVAYRGKGVARKLYEHAFTLQPLTLGSDPSPAAASSMKRAGFVSLQGPTKCLFPIYLGEIAKLKGLKLRFLDLILNPFIYFFRGWKILRQSAQFRGVATSDYVKASAPNRTNQNIKVAHDEIFVKWRCARFGDYYNGVELLGNQQGSVYSLYRDPNTYILTDYSPSTLASQVDIWSDVILEAHRNKARTVKLLVQSSRMSIFSMLMGFIPFRTKTEIIFYAADPKIRELMSNKYFNYTYLDSDENI